MLAVWYPLEFLRGIPGKADVRFVLLVTVLLFEAIGCMRKR